MGIGRRRHLFHMVHPSPWPILTSASVFFFVSGVAFYMHDVSYGGFTLLFGLMSVSYCVFFWFSDIIDEATYSGYHTKAVKAGLKWGVILFIISEIMLFFGFFWAFFHVALCPSEEFGNLYPPAGIYPIETFEFPAFNTAVLILSGISVTWTHKAMSLGRFKDAMDSLLITIFLGYFFVGLQIVEYYEAAFNYSDSVYSCNFYMLTGLHGCHVFVGASFLTVCFIRLIRRHFLTTHYLGLIFAIWYWHFVDVVWIFLFLSVYWWGNS